MKVIVFVIIATSGPRTIVFVSSPLCARKSEAESLYPCREALSCTLEFCGIFNNAIPLESVACESRILPSSEAETAAPCTGLLSASSTVTVSADPPSAPPAKRKIP